MSMNWGYAFKEGLKGFQRTPLSSMLTVSTVAITLTLFGFFMAMTYNLQRMVDRVRQQMVLEVFVAPGLSEGQTAALGQALASVPGVAEAVFISKEEALARFKDELGEDPLALLGENVLPASYQVRVDEAFRKGDEVKALAARLEAIDGVDEVVYRGRLFELVNRYSIYVYLVDGALFLLVLAASIALVANTLRLTIFSQRKIIQIMELVGATRGFIRRPYLILGMLQGALGGVLAVVSVAVVVFFVNLQFPRLVLVPLPVYGGLWLLGVGLAFWGSRIGLRRHLEAD